MLTWYDNVANFDEHDEADEETTEYVNKEAEEAEKDEANPYGKPGSLINRMIMHGNKKTEEQIAREHQEAASKTANSVPQAG